MNRDSRDTELADLLVRMFNIPNLSAVTDLRQKRNCLVVSVLNSLDNLFLGWKEKVERLKREQSVAREGGLFFQ